MLQLPGKDIVHAGIWECGNRQEGKTYLLFGWKDKTSTPQGTSLGNLTGRKLSLRASNVRLDVMGCKAFLYQLMHWQKPRTVQEGYQRMQSAVNAGYKATLRSFSAFNDSLKINFYNSLACNQYNGTPVMTQHTWLDWYRYIHTYLWQPAPINEWGMLCTQSPRFPFPWPLLLHF